MAGRMVVAVGTKKGLFVFEGGSGAKRLELRGPFFEGMPINTAMIDRRSKTPKVIAIPSSPWFGTTIQVSKDLGKKFKPTKSAPAFAADDGRTLKNVWSLAEGGDSTDYRAVTDRSPGRINFWNFCYLHFIQFLPELYVELPRPTPQQQAGTLTFAHA